MNFLRHWFRAICACGLALGLMTSASAKNLLISTQPVFLIAKEITADIETPELLLHNQTGHDIQLTPAQRKKIQDASLIIWLGKEHEAPLQKVFNDKKNAISILDSGIINRLPQRNVKGVALANTIDTHVWLEPNHAVRIGFFIAILRGQQKPEFKEQYWENAQKFAKKMYQTAQAMQRNGTAQPYWAYHDAYQYLENVLNLKFAGALTADSHANPTVAQIKYLQDNRPQKKMCLIAEGHATAKQYQHLEPVVFQMIDESMQNETQFIDGWKKMVQQLQRCLQQAKQS